MAPEPHERQLNVEHRPEELVTEERYAASLAIEMYQHTEDANPTEAVIVGGIILIGSRDHTALQRQRIVHMAERGIFDPSVFASPSVDVAHTKKSETLGELDDDAAQKLREAEEFHASKGGWLEAAVAAQVVTDIDEASVPDAVVRGLEYASNFHSDGEGVAGQFRRNAQQRVAAQLGKVGIADCRLRGQGLSPRDKARYYRHHRTVLERSVSSISEVAWAGDDYRTLRNLAREDRMPRPDECVDPDWVAKKSDSNISEAERARLDATVRYLEACEVVRRVKVSRQNLASMESGHDALGRAYRRPTRSSLQFAKAHVIGHLTEAVTRVLAGSDSDFPECFTKEELAVISHLGLLS